MKKHKNAHLIYHVTAPPCEAIKCRLVLLYLFTRNLTFKLNYVKGPLRVQDVELH